MKRLFIVTVLIFGLTATYSSGKDPNDLVDKQRHNMGGSTQKSDSDTSCPLSSADLAAAEAYLKFKKLKASFIPSGIPAVYGPELNISFDKVQDAINKVRVFGPTYGKEGNKIILTGDDLKRYVNIGTQISCEYCCRAKTLVREDGVAACGCAHSIMMRGLSAYLIKNHPTLSDEHILKELNTWKISYFPKQTLSAKLLEMEKSGDVGIREILKEFPEFLPKMVGGC
jgi:hypothetical protein